MRIQCALALKERIAMQPAMENVFEVIFQQRSTADYMMCSMAQISVQSIRWPATRFVSTSSDFITNSMQAGQRPVVDATIWVAPLCTSRARKVPEVCMPMFKAAACYPYCMASRLQGSGANGLVLYNANEWRDRVHLMHRDCNKQQIADPLRAVSEGQAQMLANGPESKDTFTSMLGNIVETFDETTAVVEGSSVVVQKWDAAVGGCVQASMTRSLVGKELFQTMSRKNTFRSILLPGQPFAYAGTHRYPLILFVSAVQVAQVSLDLS